MQKAPAFNICSCSSWLTCKACSKALPFCKVRTRERNFKQKSNSFHVSDLKCRQKLRPRILEECTHVLYRTSKLPNPCSRRDVMQSGRQREHAQYVTSLKIYFRSPLTVVASRILRCLKTVSSTLQEIAFDGSLLPLFIS